MNRLENWFCSTNFWRRLTQQRLVPWMLEGSDPGDSALELGAGPGAATPELLRRFSHVTSLEYDATFAAKLSSAAKISFAQPQRAPRRNTGGAMRVAHGSFHVVQGDATQLPFADASFSCAMAILMLHHLGSPELQDRALSEIYRVLQPGGVLLIFEINNGWLQRWIHKRSRFVPMNASTANARLNTAGFARVTVDFLRGGFLLRARRGAG